MDSSPPPSAAAASAPKLRPFSAEQVLLVIGGRYDVLDELGRGGMGVVYRVRDRVSGRELALKQLLLKERAQTRESIALFEREFYVLAQLAHPRVIAVHDYGVEPDGPFYTMELLDGGDLKELSPLPFAHACTLMVEVCSSLALLHARRLVHRDVSPRNIRCTRDRHAKLIDFGGMLPMGPCAHVVGTPGFVAPEVVHHATLDARTDLFSLGATLYFTLTGRPPFAARELAELREAWSTEPLPPSRFAPDVPPALDALCAALLRIDPAQRPRSAFEVMQRLQAIAGIAIDEPDDVAQAYLTTPALIGRDDTLRSFRQCMRRAVHGEGNALALLGAPGLGRSRALDACVLEAKTLGATVLRGSAKTTADAAFSLAYVLGSQLIELLPEVARLAADAVDVRDTLFVAAGATLTLRDLRDPTLERAAVQRAMAAWIARACDSHALLIAIDDIQHADEASTALLAGFALEAKNLRLLVQVTADCDEFPRSTTPALRILLQRATPLVLRALSREQTDALLISMFGDVPNRSLLSERLFQLGLGNPRQTVELARHLVAKGAIRYEHGQWTLPVALDARDLPANTNELLAARIAALPPLARRLAEAQALVGSVFRRQDYALLAPEASAAAIDASLLVLLRQEMLQQEGEYYALGNRTVAEALSAQLDPEQARARHLALYELYRAQPSAHPYLIVHHLLEANQHVRALDLLATHESLGAEHDEDAAVRAGPARLARTLQRALDLAVRLGRPAREAQELRRRICGLAMISDEVPYERVTAEWLTQLEQDSGLNDYRALGSASEPSTRLQQALSAAVARYAATPESERVYRVDEAIKHVAAAVVSLIVTSARSYDTEVVSKLPGLLEPFAPLSPVLHALWQNALANHEFYSGCMERSIDRWKNVYDVLSGVPPDGVRYVAGIRAGVVRVIAVVQASIGRTDALRWATELDAGLQLQASGMFARRLLCLMHGDTEGAECFGREAELLSLRASAREALPPNWEFVLNAQVLMHDVAAVRRVMDALEAGAKRHHMRGGLARLAESYYDLLRGDLPAAERGFVETEAMLRPSGAQPRTWIPIWLAAANGCMTVQLERGQPAQAAALGRALLVECDARGVDHARWQVEITLAFAEAKLGELTQAAARIDAVITQQTNCGVRGLLLAYSYVARARIAILSRDGATAARFTALAAHEPGGDKIVATAIQREPLIAEARSAGVELALTKTAFERLVLAETAAQPASPIAGKLRDDLHACPDSATRHARALELLCELAGGERGQLYLADADARLHLVAVSPGAQPSAHALDFARGFFSQQIDDDALSAGLTHVTQMLNVPGAAAYVDERGRESRLFMLTCKDRGALAYVGLASLVVRPRAQLDLQLAASIAVIAACLLRDGPGTRA